MADVPAIREVAAESWWATYRGILSDDEIRRFLAEWYAPESLERVCAASDALFFAAEESGRILGFDHAGQGKAGPELFRLYVRPERWRTGVGSILLKALEGDLTRRGVHAYRCKVHRQNDEIGKAVPDWTRRRSRCNGAYERRVRRRFGCVTEADARAGFTRGGDVFAPE